MSFSTYSYSKDKRPTYLLFYRTFLCISGVVRDVEACSDHLVSLDRAIHSTFPPVALPLQLEHISTAVYELASFSITRALKSHRIPEVPLSVIFPGLPAEQNSGTRPLASIYLPPHCPEHVDLCPFLKANSFLFHHSQQQQEQDFFPPYGQMETSNNASLFPNRKSGDETQISERGGSTQTFFSDPLEFVSVSYIPNPDSVMKSCSLCGAQVLLQSTWLNLYLLQRLHVIAVTQLGLSPFRMPPELQCLTPRVALGHLFHCAQRFFELALHSALTISGGRAMLRDRLSYPLPLLVSLVKYSKKRLVDAGIEESVRKLQEALDVETCREWEGAPFHLRNEVNTLSLLMLSPFTHWGETSEAYRLKKDRTLAAIVFCLIHFSLGLFHQVSYLWPVLELFSASKNCVSSPFASSLFSSAEENVAFSEVKKDVQDVLLSVKGGYKLDDVLVPIRATLQEVCLIGFMDGYQGATRAQQMLLRLSLTLFHLEQQWFPCCNKKCGTPVGHAPLEEKSCFSVSFAEQVYTIFSNVFFCDVKNFKSWPWTSLTENTSSLLSSSHGYDTDQVANYFEVKQIILLLTLFFDLVEERDEQEEADALTEYLLDPQKNISRVSMDSKQTLIEAINSVRTRRRQDRQHRILSAKELLSTCVEPLLVELTTSSNGGTSSRARELLGLLCLLKAEVLRFCLFSSLNVNEKAIHKGGKKANASTHASSQKEGVKEGKLDKVETEKEISKLNGEAVKHCETVREFLGATMQPAKKDDRWSSFEIYPSSLLPPVLEAQRSQRLPPDAPAGKGSRGSSSSSLSSANSNWRLWISPKNRGTREFVFRDFSLSPPSLSPSHTRASKERASRPLQPEAVYALALLPPLWIRMWLVLCRSVFRIASLDMILAKDRSCLKNSNNTQMEPPAIEEEESKKRCSSSTLKRGICATRLSGIQTSKRNSPRKMSRKPPKRKENAKLQDHLNKKNMLQAECRLNFSSEELCFWYRWHHCFIHESESTNALQESTGTTKTDQDTRSCAPFINGPYAITSLNKLLYSLLNHSIPSLPSGVTPESSFLPPREVIVAALQGYFPIFISAEATFLHYFMRELVPTRGTSSGSTLRSSESSSECDSREGCTDNRLPMNPFLVANDTTRCLFSVPSVASCIPCVCAVVRKYWQRLGSPPLCPS